MAHQFICSPSCCTSSSSSQSADDGIFLGKEGSHSKGNRISERSADQVAQYIVKNFEELLQTPEFQEVQGQHANITKRPLPQMKHSQVELGRVLGEGGFSDVFEIKRLLPAKTSTNNNNDENVCERIDASRVAVKVLRRKVTVRPGLFAACAAGLAKEGAILAALSHKNIIQIKAFSQGGLSAYASGRSDAFFIVLDRLHEMLDDRIHQQWSETNSRIKASIRNRRHKLKLFFCERLSVAVELADALAYLHRNNIIHRDIKPSNIGFDLEGTLKLFDFDVSRVLPKQTHEDEVFHLSIATGTQRYMSPECALLGQYNYKSDVYSFAILLHEMLSLELPFREVTKAQHDEVVFRMGRRPKLHDSWPKAINELLANAWADEIKCRPTMSRVHSILVETTNSMKQSSPNATTPKLRRINLSPFRRAASIYSQ